MNVSTQKLCEIAEVNPRLANRPEPETVVSFLGMADVDAQSGTTSRGHERKFRDVAKGYTQFSDGDLLVAKITPCFENGKIAQASLSHAHGAGSTEFHVVRPDQTKVDARFLLHFLRHPTVRATGEMRMTGSAGQRRVPASYLADLHVPVPSLEEQRRIAQALDHTDRLRDQRRLAISLLDDLIRSIFLDMFGAPDQAWPHVTVKDVAKDVKGSIRTGPFGSQLLREEFVDSGIPVLGIDNAVTNEFAWQGRRFITEEKYKKLERYRVYPGDVLITIMGTCGRCAIVPDDIPIAINTKHLCCVSLERSKCLPEFLHSYFLMHPVSQRYLHRTAKGAIMAGLNMGLIEDMPIALPPIAMQQDFADRVNSARKTKALHMAHLAELDGLFESLHHRAFRGELWRDSGSLAA
ncbi:restriction endonuclease subunit S [Streptomyces sp. NPDC059017]|uniref:restriction endonuclease subunit S n=1 Tax=Streptomyces sp. NPDC059017 TaxID=3346700 RepID=UPI0036B50634